MRLINVLIIIIFTSFSVRIFAQQIGIKKISVKIAPDRKFRSKDSLCAFNYNYKQFGLYADLDDTVFCEKFNLQLSKLETEKNYFMNIWVELEIHYSNDKTESFFMTYHRNGYYYKGRKIRYSPELNQLIYEKLIDKMKSGEMQYIGISANENKQRNRIHYRLKNMNPARDSIK